MARRAREQKALQEDRRQAIEYLEMMESPSVDMRYTVITAGEQRDDLTLTQAIEWVRSQFSGPANGELMVLGTIDGIPANDHYRTTFVRPGTIMDTRGGVRVYPDDDVEQKIQDIEWLQPEYRLVAHCHARREAGE